MYDRTENLIFGVQYICNCVQVDVVITSAAPPSVGNIKENIFSFIGVKESACLMHWYGRDFLLWPLPHLPQVGLLFMNFCSN